MIKKISFIIYTVLKFFDKLFNILTKKNFLIWFSDFLQNDSYKNIKILNNRIIFFTPNQLTEWRVNTLFSKEPETLEWINSFQKKENLIFWDIGANVGLYSIYNSIVNKNSITISFEPSSSNLRVLSRNISINNLENNIKILPLALTNKKNEFLLMNENSFIEGGALNSFGESYDFKGEKFIAKMKYTTLGTSINSLLDNRILEIPDYIKIDVDGIEHLILEGGDKYLNNKKIKSMSVEINENFTEQFNKILNLMAKYGFKILHKKQNHNLASVKSEFSQTFNYVFIR